MNWLTIFAVFGILAMLATWFPDRVLDIRAKKPWLYHLLGLLSASLQLPFVMLAFTTTVSWPWGGRLADALLLALPIQYVALVICLGGIQLWRARRYEAIPFSLGFYATLMLTPIVWYSVTILAILYLAGR